VERLKELLPKIEDHPSHTNEKILNTQKFENGNIQIPQVDYIEIFQKIFDIYGIKKEIRVEDRGNIYDGEEYL